MTTTEIVKNLKSVPVGVWYKVVNKSGYDMTEIIKDLIDEREQFELSNDYKYFKRIDDKFLLN